MCLIVSIMFSLFACIQSPEKDLLDTTTYENLDEFINDFFKNSEFQNKENKSFLKNAFVKENVSFPIDKSTEGESKISYFKDGIMEIIRTNDQTISAVIKPKAVETNEGDIAIVSQEGVVINKETNVEDNIESRFSLTKVRSEISRSLTINTIPECGVIVSVYEDGTVETQEISVDDFEQGYPFWKDWFVIFRDLDDDGVDDEDDEDDDGDGVPDDSDADLDGDGQLNECDPDVDGDGLLNGEDDDIDNDGIPNDQDDNPNGPYFEDQFDWVKGHPDWFRDHPNWEDLLGCWIGGGLN